MALAVRPDPRWRPIAIVSLAAGALFVVFLLLPWGIATFLLVIVTLFAWLATAGLSLATYLSGQSRLGSLRGSGGVCSRSWPTTTTPRS